MNRSFRAQESQMQSAVERQRQQLRASMMAEKEDELALFLEMRRREKEQDNLLLNNREEVDAPSGSRTGSSTIFNTSVSISSRKTSTDDFLNSEGDKNDYDWLITPPGTPLFPSLEMESPKTVMSQLDDPKARPTALNSRLGNPPAEPAAKSNLASRQLISSPGLSTSSGGTRRPSSSGGPGSRPGTPTGRSTPTTSCKPSRSSTPTSRATLPSTTRASISTARSVSTRPTSTATKPTGSAPKLSSMGAKATASGTKAIGSVSKSTATMMKPTVPTRSTTPLSRSISRSSTPTSRPTAPPTKSISRSATPTRRPTATTSTPTKTSPSQVKSSSQVTKPAPKQSPSKNPVSSRGTSPVRSKPWKPSDMPGFSLETPPNLRTTLPDRPLSATRGRPGAPSSRSASVEPGPTGRPKRQSCSPSRGRTPNGAMMHASGSSVPAFSRIYSKANDNVSPVVMGTQMVERVINMRKLAPPRSDGKNSPHGNLSAKSLSPDSSGFGRSLSKKSLDMAMRHMDIRRSIPNNLRPLMTNIPASSMYSVRSGPPRSRTVSVSDSPLATSSNASSEISVNNNGLCLDASEREEDHAGSERSCRSPANVQDR